MRSIINSFILFVLLSQCIYAQHTFSIVAVDTATGEVGTAGATCLTSADCGGCGGAVIIASIFPGLGALNSQATVCIPNVNGINGMRQIIEGAGAEEALTWLLNNDACQFGTVNNRQYGIAMINDQGEAETAAYTGSNALDFAGDRKGVNYAIQGNILIGDQVLEGMEQGFLNSNGNLAERLMAAMQGANIPGADSRCLVDGISSESAFIKVARPDDPINDLYLDLNVPSTIDFAEPIDSLQTLFDQWLTTSVKEIMHENHVRVWPNPTKHSLFLQIDPQISIDEISLQLFNADGMILKEQEVGTNKSSIDIIDLNVETGVLFYRLLKEGKVLMSNKILINKN